MKHGRGWEGAASEFDVTRRGVRHLTRCVGAMFELFLFIFISWICVDLARFALNRLRFTLNRANSARVKSYRPN